MEKITISGTPEEIGFQHGKLLSEQIHRNLEFYKPLFLSNQGDEARVLKAAKSFKDLIYNFNPNYCTEIEHIALGAEVLEPLWIYGLNSRTELALSGAMNECTAVVFPRQNIIGQTWDWAQHLENHSVIMEIEFPSGHRILQLTEAGMIGKIGLNNKGLGLTLNLLRVENQNLTGVPIHIVLRAVLESRSLKEAKKIVHLSGNGKASNIIMAQVGRAINVEFTPEETYYREIRDEAYLHTNHYLHAEKPIQIAEISYENSLGRYTTAVDKLGTVDEYSLHGMVSILSDQTNDAAPILATYEPHSIKEMGNCGTLATVLMDLERRTLKVRVGNPGSVSFSMDKFAEYQIKP